MEDEAVDIVDEVGERDLRFGARDADGADEQPHLILLTGEHVLDARAHGRSFGIRPGRTPGHRLTFGLFAMDPADPVRRLQPRLVGLAPIGGVGPDVRGGVVAGNDVAQHPSIEPCAVGDLGRSDEPVAPADRDTAFVTEARDRDVDPRSAARQRPRLGELHRPARVSILLRRFGWLVGPDLHRALATP